MILEKEEVSDGNCVDGPSWNLFDAFLQVRSPDELDLEALLECRRELRPWGYGQNPKPLVHKP